MFARRESAGIQRREFKVKVPEKAVPHFKPGVELKDRGNEANGESVKKLAA